MTTLIEFLSAQNHNLLTSLFNFHNDLYVFECLNELYQPPPEIFPPKSDSSRIIWQFLRFTHYHLLFSYSCFLRGHVTECFFSTRKAIDATLSAYYILKNPTCAVDYLNRNKTFKKIKDVVKKEIERDENSYPLAKWLVDLHETYSQYGGHADISTFSFRLNMIRDSENKIRNMIFVYFDVPGDVNTEDGKKEYERYKAFGLISLAAFFNMLMIYYEFLKSSGGLFGREWMEKYGGLKKYLGEKVVHIKDMGVQSSTSPV